jgi:hypothetical protein
VSEVTEADVTTATTTAELSVFASVRTTVGIDVGCTLLKKTLQQQCQNVAVGVGALGLRRVGFLINCAVTMIGDIDVFVSIDYVCAEDIRTARRIAEELISTGRRYSVSSFVLTYEKHLLDKPSDSRCDECRQCWRTRLRTQDNVDFSVCAQHLNFLVEGESRQSHPGWEARPSWGRGERACAPSTCVVLSSTRRAVKFHLSAYLIAFCALSPS